MFFFIITIIVIQNHIRNGKMIIRLNAKSITQVQPTGWKKLVQCEMFLNSIEKRGLIYETFVGDGDTGSLMIPEVLLLQNRHVMISLGMFYIVVKEECVGHIQKMNGKWIERI